MTFQKCASQHFGFWCVEPHWFQAAIAAVKAGEWQPVAASTDGDNRGEAYNVDGAGIATIPISGQITKGRSSYGGTSSVETRIALRRAANDSRVKGVMLAIDSPGGTVAGTAELANDVRRLGKQKPVHAHVDDLGASAAYWVAAQASRLTASETSEIGSIGTMAVVEDLSGAADAAGIEVHVISTGPHKGDLVPGTKVTKQQLAEVQGRVDDLNEHFLKAVAKGRGVSLDAVDGWADGRVHIANKAKKIGLIDSVESFEQAYTELQEVARPRRDKRNAIAIKEQELMI